jgi:hypothetical protein
MKDKLIWKLRRWFKYELKYLHYQIWDGFKNLYNWFPLVWKDRDFDDFFIFEALKFKIAKTSKYISKKQRYVGWEDDVRYMNICVRLIDRIQENWYQTEYLDYQDSEFNFTPTDKNLYELKTKLIRNDLSTYVKKYPLYERKLYSDKSKRFESYIKNNSLTSICLGIGILRHEKAKKLLFTILERKIEHWWD